MTRPASTVAGAIPQELTTWSEVLRAIREARGVTQDGWAALLGVGRRTVQRWERGEAVPDAALERAILEICTTHRLFRRYSSGPRGGATLSAELLHDLLAEARVRPRAADAAAASSAPVAAQAAGVRVLPRLPAATTTFIGRAAEQEALRQALRESRLVTLTGPGGCGKTRLALAVAPALAPQFPDSVWLVELAPLSDAALIAPTVVTALGLREEANQAAMAGLLTHLRSRRLLLLLDNCEHLIDGCAELVDALLRACPRVTVLTTSREPLAIAGEVLLPVPALTLPAEEAGEELGEVERSEAVQLFVERARAVQPQFRLAVENARAVTQVCRRLDGNPLAIELAAARTRILSAEQIESRLNDRFALLTTGRRAGPARHQTLRALADWSYGLLRPRERALFARLSVFAGSFDLAAAESVCDADLDRLAALVDKSLLLAEERAGVVRYRLLDTLRVYAAERLAERSGAVDVERRLCAFYLALAERVEPTLVGPEPARWLRLLSEEYDNIRAVLDWCERAADRATAGLRLAGALWRFWDLRGHLAEGGDRLQRLLARGQDAPPDVLGRAHLAAGNLVQSQGDFRRADSHYQATLRYARAAGDPATIAAALSNSAIVHGNRGEYQAARAMFDEALALRRELADQWGIGNTLHNLAYLAYHEGEREQARRLYEECLQVQRAGGHAAAAAGTMNNLGRLAQAERRHQDARALFEESLAARRRLEDERGIVASLCCLGTTAACLGEHARAEALFAEGLRICRRLGMRQHIASCLEGLGAAARERGDPDGAAHLLGAAAALREAWRAPLPPAERELREAAIALVRSDLGEERYRAAWERGRAMEPERAIALALAGSVAEAPTAESGA